MESAQISERARLAERTEPAEEAAGGMALLGIMIAAIGGGVFGIVIGIVIATLL